MKLRTISYCLTLIALIAAFATSTAVHVAPALAAGPNAPQPQAGKADPKVDTQSGINDRGTSGGSGLPDVPGGGFPNNAQLCSGSACGGTGPNCADMDADHRAAYRCDDIPVVNVPAPRDPNAVLDKLIQGPQCRGLTRLACAQRLHAADWMSHQPAPAPAGACEAGNAPGCAVVLGCPPVIRAACEAQVQSGAIKFQDPPPAEPS